MRDIKPFYLIVFLLFFSMDSIAESAFDPSALVKVDSSNKSACVEYYHYQGSLYCSLKAMQASAVDPSIKNDEQQKIVFDERPWVIAWGKKTAEITTIEYVPAGDDINNWNELITSQFIPNFPQSTSLNDYVNNIKQNLIAFGFRVDFKILQESQNQVILEFKISHPKNQQQDEIQKVMRMPNGIFILHYVIKKADMGEANRQKWLSNLIKSTVIETKK